MAESRDRLLSGRAFTVRQAARRSTARHPRRRYGRPGGHPARHGRATWPATSAVTLKLEGRHGRVSVVVTCPAGPHRLSFTAYALGDPGSLVRGACVANGGNAPMTRSLRLPASVSPARVRVRVRPGPEARGGPVQWFAGVYGHTSP